MLTALSGAQWDTRSFFWIASGLPYAKSRAVFCLPLVPYKVTGDHTDFLGFASSIISEYAVSNGAGETVASGGRELVNVLAGVAERMLLAFCRISFCVISFVISLSSLYICRKWSALSKYCFFVTLSLSRRYCTPETTGFSLDSMGACAMSSSRGCGMAAGGALFCRSIRIFISLSFRKIILYWPLRGINWHWVSERKYLQRNGQWARENKKRRG